jgi:hypothetical protein
MLLDGILRETLSELLDELRSNTHHVSEHAVLNLFVFGYLVPAFQKYGWDLTLTGIEVSVLQVEKETPTRLGTRKDLVFWKQPRSTRWKGCNISLPIDEAYVREHGCKPLAVVEWKNISRFTLKPMVVKAAHESDVKWLRTNVGKNMFDVGYAILVDQREEGSPRLHCRRLTKDGEEQFLLVPKAIATSG